MTIQWARLWKTSAHTHPEQSTVQDMSKDCREDPIFANQTKYAYIFQTNTHPQPFCLSTPEIQFDCIFSFSYFFYSFLSSRMHLLMPLKDSLCSARWIMGSLMCCSTIPPKSCCVLWGPTLPGWGPVTPPYWRLLTAKVQWSKAVIVLCKCQYCKWLVRGLYCWNQNFYNIFFSKNISERASKNCNHLLDH